MSGLCGGAAPRTAGQAPALPSQVLGRATLQLPLTSQCKKGPPGPQHSCKGATAPIPQGARHGKATVVWTDTWLPAPCQVTSRVSGLNSPNSRGKRLKSAQTLPDHRGRAGGQCTPGSVPPRVHGAVATAMASFPLDVHNATRQGLHQLLTPFADEKTEAQGWSPA